MHLPWVDVLFITHITEQGLLWVRMSSLLHISVGTPGLIISEQFMFTTEGIIWNFQESNSYFYISFVCLWIEQQFKYVLYGKAFKFLVVTCTLEDLLIASNFFFVVCVLEMKWGEIKHAAVLNALLQNAKVVLIKFS